jgi:transketolase
MYKYIQLDFLFLFECLFQWTGAYILADAEDKNPQVIFLGTGADVHLCLDAYEVLKSKGIKARVVR